MQLPSNIQKPFAKVFHGLGLVPVTEYFNKSCCDALPHCDTCGTKLGPHYGSNENMYCIEHVPRAA
jgi:hypothetical protein